MPDATPEQQVAVVTGASRGIGAHLANAFAAAGYVVAACSYFGKRADGAAPADSEPPAADAAPETPAAEPPAGPAGSAPRRRPYDVAAVDVTDEAAVRRFVGDILTTHGRIDVLVNNAGVIDDEVPLAESDPRDWWRCIEVDLRGPYLLTRMALPGMLARRSGRVINLNSGAGTRPDEVFSAYAVAKAGLARLTGATHLAGRGRGVYAFDLMPGVVRTDMTGGMAIHEDRTDWTAPEAVTDLALALASGRLDAWSGRFVRAGADTVEALVAAAEGGLPRKVRTLALTPYGVTDPVA
ncbi:MAG: SDR family oxidoreductase [Austwickia sp.]|nr:MAG: SDR family oxidoreductase [Austwickia sp.]